MGINTFPKEKSIGSVYGIMGVWHSKLLRGLSFLERRGLSRSELGGFWTAKEQRKGKGALAVGVLPPGSQWASQHNCLIIHYNSCLQTGEPQTLAYSCLRCFPNHPIGEAMDLGYNFCACAGNIHTLLFHGEPLSTQERELHSEYLMIKHFISQKISFTVAHLSSRFPAQIKKKIVVLVNLFPGTFFLFQAFL